MVKEAFRSFTSIKVAMQQCKKVTSESTEVLATTCTHHAEWPLSMSFYYIIGSLTCKLQFNVVVGRGKDHFNCFLILLGN